MAKHLGLRGLDLRIMRQIAAASRMPTETLLATPDDGEYGPLVIFEESV